MFRAILRGFGVVLSALGNLYLGVVASAGEFMDEKIGEMEGRIERRGVRREIRARNAAKLRWLGGFVFDANDPVQVARVVFHLHKQVERLRGRAERVQGEDVTAGNLTARHLRDRAKEVEGLAELVANLSFADLQRLCREAHNQ